MVWNGDKMWSGEMGEKEYSEMMWACEKNVRRDFGEMNIPK